VVARAAQSNRQINGTMKTDTTKNQSSSSRGSGHFEFDCKDIWPDAASPSGFSLSGARAIALSGGVGKMNEAGACPGLIVVVRTTGPIAEVGDRASHSPINCWSSA
jgi:hypothetical protein